MTEKLLTGTLSLNTTNQQTETTLFELLSFFLIQTLNYCSFHYHYNFTLGPGHEKTCLMPYANNKGADQPAHPRSLISTFVVRYLYSMIYIAISEVSRF